MQSQPHLIYIHYQKDHICLEVWAITSSQPIHYSRKWRIAFDAFLLSKHIATKTHSLPITLSRVGGCILPKVDGKTPYQSLPFDLTPYQTWIPRLLSRWEQDAQSPSSLSRYEMTTRCTSCPYFSYCYQETLTSKPPSPPEMDITVVNPRPSAHFSEKTQHWFFLHSNKKVIQWQLWENGSIESTTQLHFVDFANPADWIATAKKQLLNAWNRSRHQQKTPHFLVYEPGDWHQLQTTLSLHLFAELRTLDSPWSSIQQILTSQFTWPVAGRLTLTQVADCLGLIYDHPRPLSLYHREVEEDAYFDLARQIWNWCLPKIAKQTHPLSFLERKTPSLIERYQHIHRREIIAREEEIQTFQTQSPQERVEQFRAIGPIRFVRKETMANTRKLYVFSFDRALPLSKFKAGDFSSSLFWEIEPFKRELPSF